MTILVNRYANALLDISQERNNLEVDFEQALFVRDTLNNEEDRAFLMNPHIPESDKIEMFEENFLEAIDDYLMNFLHLMIRKDRASLIVPALTEYLNMASRNLGKVRAKIVSARELTDEQVESIHAILTKKLDKRVQIKTEVDPDVIGGFYVLADGHIFDATIRSELNRMREGLKRGGGTSDMKIKPDEIKNVIKHQIESFSSDFEFSEVGTVIQIGDGIARVYGLNSAMSGELLEFSNGTFGMALNLDEDSIGVVVMGSDAGIKEGDPVKLTGRMAEVPVGDGMLGRIVNSLGEPIDNKGSIEVDNYRRIEGQAPSVIMRQEVNQPLQTGIKAIDALVPIGKGQRELIIGDRETGKTAIAIDTIINQKGKDVYCVYVAIGQKSSTVARIIKVLNETGAIDYTTVVLSTASDPTSLQYFAPYAGCAIADEWMHQGKDVLVIYDDLSKHAVAYRAISLLLRRPPGREAYPGDIFYLHSRLLERAASMSEEYGGGTLTALPIVETQENDISAYIPTNIISITDGQIYLESDLFNHGIRPAINPGLSVSRVGGSAQIPAMKELAGPLRIEFAQYNELSVFSQFGTDLDQDTLERLNHGENIMEILKQPQYEPMPIEDQVLIFYALSKKHLTGIDRNRVLKFQRDFLKYVDTNASELKEEISKTGDVSEELGKKIDAAIAEVKEQYNYK